MIYMRDEMEKVQMKYKYIILGAGPAGLTAANMLIHKMGIDSVLVLEYEKEAGGLCRSVEVDGSPFDIGGGHFLDVRRPEVNEFLFEFMPEEEWNIFNRDSRIEIHGGVINYPIEANIWQMKLENQVDYLEKIATAGCNMGTEIPEKFVEWIYWKLGDEIAKNYMLPYNQKMFGENLSQLGTYWLEKLPNVSFRETILSCLTHKSYGEQPGHVKFYYPKKYGYGELWLRMAEKISEHMEYDKKVNSIDFENMTVGCADGSKYSAERIISTIPWMEFEELAGMPEEIKSLIQELKYSSIQIEYYGENLETEAQWIYYPDLDLPYHRILVRSNFCTDSKGYWTETNSERISMEHKSGEYEYMNQYAYPLNTLNKPEIMEKLLSWCREKQVYGLGRWGEHQHYNSDLTVKLAMDMVKKIENDRLQ